MVFISQALDLLRRLTLYRPMRLHTFAILSLTALLALCGCANKKGKQYAGVDGDYVSGTPLGERTEGANFLGSNVQRGQYAPVQFGYDSSSVTPDQEPKVEAVASAMKGGGKTVIVAGFTDERGTEEYNRSLGEKRALSVREALIAKGLRANNVQTVSVGRERPVDPASNDAAWAKNRRAEFGIVK